MQTNVLRDLTAESRSLVEEVGLFIAGEIGRVTEEAIEEKEVNSLVSYVDKTAESKLVAGLGRLLPEAVFLTEEDTVQNETGDYRWIIDPLDGTTNFLHQLPVFSISVALEEKGVLQLGIVLEINRKESFYAWKGGGAYLNGNTIRVSPRNSMAHSLIATGFPYQEDGHMTGYIEVLKAAMRSTRGIRRLGSAAVDLAYVAAGRFEAFYEYSLNAWDVAGGALIVQEAGGKVTDFKGEDNFLFGKELLAGTPAIHPEMLKIIQSCMHS